MRISNQMDFHTKTIIFLATVVIVGAAGLPATQAGPMLSEVSVEPEMIKVSGDTARIAFHLSEPSIVTLYIVDPDGWPIKTMLNQEPMPAGRSTLQWDGADDNNRPVPDEAYSIYIRAENGGESAVYSPGADSGGLTASVYPEVDQSSLPVRIRFDLTEPLRVRVRIGIDRGPLMSTPVDWRPMAPGRHEVVWDGTGMNGKLSLDLTQVRVLVDAFTLPRIVILTKGNDVKYSSYKFTRAQDIGGWNELLLQGIGFEGRAQSPGFHSHAGLTRIVDQQPGFTMSASIGPGKSNSRELNVKLNLDEVTMWILPQSRFEVKMYINNELIIEEEQGFAPYTFNLPWNDAWGDDALVTINIATLHDQVGSMSRRMSNP